MGKKDRNIIAYSREKVKFFCKIGVDKGIELCYNGLNGAHVVLKDVDEFISETK